MGRICNNGLRDSNYDQLTSSNPRNQATVQDGRVVVQNVQGRQNRGQGNNAWGAGTAGYGGALNRVGNANPSQARQVKCYNCNDIGHIARNCTPKRPHNSKSFKDKMLLMQAQENGVALDEEQLIFLADVRPSYDKTFYLRYTTMITIPEMLFVNIMKYEMHDDVQPNYVVDSHADYTSNSNMIPYDQYVKDNAVPVVQSNVSSVTNDAYMMIYNDICEPHAQSVSKTTQNIIFANSLTAELETSKEQELHSVKLQLASTINHNKSMVEEVTSLKKYFKQKENKYLEEFLDMKALKEKVEDRLYKQDQSLQTVHMLCKPKPYYNELNKVAIGYKNPLCLTCAKQVQPALYNGYEIVKNNHVLAIVHNTEDTLEIAETTRKKMHDKMKDPECVTLKVKTAPPDYSKENYLATFTPQKQLTPEQIFWSQDIIKMKAKALKEQTTVPPPPPLRPPSVDSVSDKYTSNAVPKECSQQRVKERGFEQTKACYLTEVIPFFKTLKEHFEGIQKALTKEVKEMKEIFEELEAEVDQHVVDRKHDEIEQKNLLIANDNC
ncbi:retrovirus-related pol polyprotein from transposon TNT 1-94 [Tanacetum coccineum]